MTSSKLKENVWCKGQESRQTTEKKKKKAEAYNSKMDSDSRNLYFSLKFFGAYMPNTQQALKFLYPHITHGQILYFSYTEIAEASHEPPFYESQMM